MSGPPCGEGIEYTFPSGAAAVCCTRGVVLVGNCVREEMTEPGPRSAARAAGLDLRSLEREKVAEVPRSPRRDVARDWRKLPRDLA